MNEIISYIQLTANAFALSVAAWIYLAYVKNLNSTVGLKEEQVKIVEKQLVYLKDRLSEMEKRSPENMEKLLNERIRIREDELNRLNDDKKDHQKEIEIRNEQLHRLKNELEKTKDIRRTIELLDLNFENESDDLFSADAELEIEEIGLVAVDSGQLMICDPCYINSEWQGDEFEDIRLLKDSETGDIYQFRKDFSHYDEKIIGFNKTVNELVALGQLESIEIDMSDKINFSYAGACYATNSKNGYGSMPFKLGHEGAGIAITTLLGDGMYPVYAEKYDGKLVRVYVNLM